MEKEIGRYAGGLDLSDEGDAQRGKAALWMLKNKLAHSSSPFFLSAYFASFDESAHQNGVYSKEAARSLEKIDAILGKLFQAAEEDASSCNKNFIQSVHSRNEEKGNGKCSSYQALCTAVASCVGSGNIAGVSTAILAGGPGALFWMWVAAFFGMATKFGEIVLGICYHGEDEKKQMIGGPMYYIVHGLKFKWIGGLTAVLLFIQNAGAALIQSNTISGVVSEAFHMPALLTGVGLAAAMSLVIRGGFRSLVHVAKKIVPVMAGLYVAGGLVVILVNAGEIPGMLQSVFAGAFSLKAGAGALAGISMREAMRYGMPEDFTPTRQVRALLRSFILQQK